jgi:Protein of unknown function (DUF3485)
MTVSHWKVGWSVIGLGGVLLGVAIAFQFLYRLRETPLPVARVRLADALPRSLEGWTVTEEPLGQTEIVNAAVLKTLNLDDYVYRGFRRGEISFSIYSAYWAPGRMPTRLVASHTPDRCWTENGMRCVEMGFRRTYSVDTKHLLPAEYRVFTGSSGASRTYVAYWHLVEGQVYDYGARFNAVPSPWLWWKDTLAQAAYGSREQIFVRMVSTQPFEEIWQEKGFQTVMSAVAGMGLWAPGR